MRLTTKIQTTKTPTTDEYLQTLINSGRISRIGAEGFRGMTIDQINASLNMTASEFDAISNRIGFTGVK